MGTLRGGGEEGMVMGGVGEQEGGSRGNMGGSWGGGSDLVTREAKGWTCSEVPMMSSRSTFWKSCGEWGGHVTTGGCVCVPRAPPPPAINLGGVQAPPPPPPNPLTDFMRV